MATLSGEGKLTYFNGAVYYQWRWCRYASVWQGFCGTNQTTGGKVFT